SSTVPSLTLLTTKRIIGSDSAIRQEQTMKKNLYFAVVICIVLTLAAAGSAAAQWEDEDEPSRFGLSMSLFRPSKSELSDIADVWLGPVLTYHIKFDENQRPVILASAGFIGKERNS